MAESTKNSTSSSKKKETEEEKRNKALREAYAKSMENYEATSNQLLESIRRNGMSIHVPNPQENAKQRPEEISDIHILIAQQIPSYVKEGEDDSEEQEKKATEQLLSSSSESDDSDSSSSNSK